ncbi:MAG: hypothetical protein DDT20_01922 [Firmicutes bacterium]|nr:hypothetical protein [Bacillota bacterium]
MKVMVTELCEASAPRDFEFVLSMTPLELQGTDFVPVSPPHIRLRLRREGSKIEVGAAVRARMHSPCARCLADSITNLNVAVTDQWPLCGTNDETADFLASPFIEDAGRIVNLTEYGSALLVEHLPVRVLCSGNCRGLCPTCGINRNEGECTCGNSELDPRLAVLGRLLHDKGGVRDGTTEKKNI